MGFRLIPTETFQQTVTVSVAQEKGGWQEESFQAVFRRAPEEERESLMQLKNTDLVRDRLVGWKMRDDSGQDVPFNDENLDAFLRLTGAIRETAIAFWRGNTGAREKN